jgi:hypothetical protein
MLVMCCYCHEKLATGRYAFLNKQEEVVDNPFCSEHSTQVFHQTKKGLETLHKTGSLAREHFLLQRWSASEEPSEMPKDKQDLFSKGVLYVA